MSLQKLTLVQLKEKCRKAGLPVSGTKAALIERLDEEAGRGGAESEESEESSSEEVAPKKKAPQAKRKAEDEGDAPPKKKGKFSIAVDERCPLGSAEVWEDWAVMLNQTNLGNNNNKFYVIQLIQSGKSYYCFTRWGRVGDKGQCSNKACASLSAAQTEFKKKFREKTRNEWDSVRGDPSSFQTVKGLYTLIEMDHDEDAAAELEEAIDTIAKARANKREKPCTLPQETQNLVKIIFDNDMFKQSMKEMDLDLKKMPLGKLSNAQIEKGYSILEEIEEVINSGRHAKLEALCNKFYTHIPHSFGRRVLPLIGDAESLQGKKDMLAVLSDIALAQRLASKKEDDDEDVLEVDHPLDVNYKLLKSDIQPIDRASNEFSVIQTYLNNTMAVGRPLKILDVFEVRRDGETERFAEHEELGNRRLLWHGTNVAVVVAILSSGLRIMPHSGGRVGKGIYFASENAKSAGYVRTTTDGVGFMFLNEVALGKEHWIHQDDSSLVRAPKGYDSIVAKGWTEPDPDKDTTIILDGKEVTVPQGKPIKQPEWNAKSSFTQSEYLIYKESQCQVRYLLKLQFT